ncbi:MAG: peptide chain release factor 1 [Planctomycetota bacterium]
MNQGLLNKLEQTRHRYHDLEKLLSEPATASNPALSTMYSREHGALAKTVLKFEQFLSIQKQKTEAESILQDQEADAELRELAKEEAAQLDGKLKELHDQLIDIFVAEDPAEDKDVIVEIRAGTGGDEAALFAADLFRMYSRYAEKRGWKIEIMDSSPTELGGFKEVIFAVEGKGAFQSLQHESGTHRVQRVPVTEQGGRIHTSAATVAVLPEAPPVEIEIADSDLRIERVKSSGPGGQSVNKLSLAIRLTHLPTGMIVQCQDEKSQTRNLAKAMRVLRARLLAQKEEEERSKRDATRRIQIGTGDRSEKIRTYNFPDNRVTDHRIKFTVHALKDVLMGELNPIIRALADYAKEERLKRLGAA